MKSRPSWRSPAELREVPRELLALIAAGLGRLDPHGDPQELAGAVSTIFGQFREFASSVTDFYTYIGSVLARSDLDGDEWTGFKALLIDYLESIVESVRLHGPTIATALEHVRPDIGTIVERLGDGGFAALEAARPGGEETERARGRRREDWVTWRNGSLALAPASFVTPPIVPLGPCSTASSGSMPLPPRSLLCAGTFSSSPGGSTSPLRPRPM